MKAPIDKTPENKNQVNTNAASQAQGGSEGLHLFTDNRPETAQLQQLQGMANQFTEQIQLPIQKKKNNTGLPDNLKSGIENLSGMSMDDVKVHRNSDKPAQLNAHAYAQGMDIHLGSGREKHLPHEAWHLVQQKQGRVKPTMQMKSNPSTALRAGVNVNDDDGLEKEADVMGAKALMDPEKEALKSDVLIQPKAISVIQRMIWTYADGKWRDGDWAEAPLGGPMGLPKKAWKNYETWDDTKVESAPVVVEETTDIAAAYNVKRACALQALIGYGMNPYGQSTAKDLHKHIWATEKLAAYREYDIQWEALYKSLGLNKIENPAKKINQLPDGKYLCEVAGHMMAVTVAGGDPTLHQDKGNAIGKVKDAILQTFQ